MKYILIILISISTSAYSQEDYFFNWMIKEIYSFEKSVKKAVRSFKPGVNFAKKVKEKYKPTKITNSDIRFLSQKVETSWKEYLKGIDKDHQSRSMFLDFTPQNLKKLTLPDSKYHLEYYKCQEAFEKSQTDIALYLTMINELQTLTQSNIELLPIIQKVSKYDDATSRSKQYPDRDKDKKIIIDAFVAEYGTTLQEVVSKYLDDTLYYDDNNYDCNTEIFTSLDFKSFLDFQKEFKEEYLRKIQDFGLNNTKKSHLLNIKPYKNKYVQSTSDLFNLIQTNNPNMEDIINNFEAYILNKKLIPNQIAEIFDAISKIVFSKDQSQDINFYKGNMVYHKNEGLVNYGSFHLLQSNPRLMVYELFPKNDPGLNTNGSELIYDEIPFLWSLPHKSVDIFKSYQSITHNEIDTMDLIGITGHDDVETALKQSNHAYDLLFPLSNRYSNGLSQFMYPNSVKGLNVSKKTIHKFKSQYNKMKKFFADNNEKLLEEGLELDDESFRAGYYHMIGGMYVANQLIKNGYSNIYGFEIIPEILGFMAKVYKIMAFLNYLNEDQSELLTKHGYCANGNLSSTPNWSKEKLEWTKMSLDLLFMHVDLAEEQHRLGAKFAIKKAKAFLNKK